ncbi:MAG TPA: hypothetical protein VF331_13320 [Polyangiales bacterium]
MRNLFAFAALLVGLALPLSAFAEQRADWLMAAPGAPGNYANVDVVFGAVQGALEHRENIYGAANQLTLRGSAIAAVPFGGGQVDADLRLLVLTLGMSGGVTDSWRNQSFGANEQMTRKERRMREAAGEFNSASYGFWEGRIGLDLPFNDYALLHSVTSYRYSGAPARSFDNLIGVVHDGNYLRSDWQLFAKHRDWGAIGPMFQLLNYPLGNKLITQLNYGFALVTRAGLVRRDDFVFFQMLWNVGDALGGYDNRDNYGFAMLRGPIMFTLAYRSVISL